MIKWKPSHAWQEMLLGLVLSSSLSAHAGVTVVQGVLPGATSWPGSPIIQTVTNPAVQATVGESFNAVGGCTNYGQTFTITTTNYTLQRISVYAGGGTGTGVGTNLTLRLFDLGTQAAPNPSPYSPGTDLFNSGNGLAITYTPQASGVLQFDFTGSDQVTLLNDHLYAFEINGVLNSSPLLWQRTTSDTYSGGAAYRNQSWINGGNAREFALAVYGVTTTNSPSLSSSCVVNWNEVRQVIDGFGASSAWRSTWNTAQGEMFFSTNSGNAFGRNGTPYSYTGVGLSLLRTRIAPGGTTVEQNIMQMAQARGARVWSSPWSPAPAAQFKSNTNVNGGNFIGNTTNYQDYAGQLAKYVVNMKNQYGINLYALSIQNEPDANVTTYESCKWTAQQIHDFLPYLSSALTASNVAATKIMLPESQNWTDPGNLRGLTMNDPVTAALVGIIANHNYVANNSTGDQNPPAALNNYGKALWQTEVAKLSGDDSSIADGLYWADRVHQFLTVAQANAWHYWWLCAYGTSNEGLCDTNDVPAKRMYTLGNFSRFVRPGFYRVGISNNTGALQISAYKNLTNGNFAIVAINNNATDVEQVFNLAGFKTARVTPWLTSASASLAAQPAVVVNGVVFTNIIPAQSIVTFTGQASNTAPTFAAMANQTVNAGITLSLTNAATDPDVPAQVLSFTLLNGPTNATLIASTGILSWRPLVSQASTTNLVTVKVSDSGAPSLSATNSYTITVNPLASPGFTGINLTGGQLLLTATGALGPDYTLLSSTNLANWQLLLVTNPTAMPLQLTTPNSVEPQRYFRLQLGP